MSVFRGCHAISAIYQGRYNIAQHSTQYLCISINGAQHLNALQFHESMCDLACHGRRVCAACTGVKICFTAFISFPN